MLAVDKFLQTLLLLGLAGYGVKSAVEMSSETIKELATKENLAAAKTVMDSATRPVEINGETIEIDDETDVMKLYKRAQSEADKMMRTGDYSVYEEQLEKNEDFLNMLDAIGGGGSKNDTEK